MGSAPSVLDFLLQCSGPAWGLARSGRQDYRYRPKDKEEDESEQRLVTGPSEQSQGAEERKAGSPPAASGTECVAGPFTTRPQGSDSSSTLSA